MSTILIIPYRDREEHLKYFNKKVIPLLKKYIPDIIKATPIAINIPDVIIIN